MEEYIIYRSCNSNFIGPVPKSKNYYTCTIKYDKNIISKSNIAIFIKSIIFDYNKILKLKELLNTIPCIDRIVKTRVFYIWVYINKKLFPFDIFYSNKSFDIDILKKNKYIIYSRYVDEKINELDFSINIEKSI